MAPVCTVYSIRFTEGDNLLSFSLKSHKFTMSRLDFSGAKTLEHVRVQHMGDDGEEFLGNPKTCVKVWIKVLCR